MGLDTGDRAGDVIILPGDEARFGDVLGLRGDGIRTGLDIGLGFIIRIGLDVGDKARASNVEEVSATLLGVPDLMGLPLPFSLLIISFFGDELGEVKGLDLGVPGVSVSELIAELMWGLEGATSVSADADVWPEKLGTKSLPSSELS